MQVMETRIRVKQIQAPRLHAQARMGGLRPNKHAVMFVHPEEALTFHYEKNEFDPRVAHSLTLEVDSFGVTTKQAAVVYGRGLFWGVGGPPSSVNTNEIQTEQTLTHVVVGTAEVAHFPEAAAQSTATYRLGVPLSERSYELNPALWLMPMNGLVTPEQVRFYWDNSAEVSYETAANQGQRRELGAVTHRYYDSANFPAALPEGTADAKALPHESYARSFTVGMIEQVYADKVDAADLVATGYEDRGSEGFLTHSGRLIYSPDNFYLPIQAIDPMGRVTNLTYDTPHLFVTEVTDPLGNTSTADIDYRVLAPWQTTDPNGQSRPSRL